MCWKAKSHQICILKGLRLMLRLLLLLLFNSRASAASWPLLQPLPLSFLSRSDWIMHLSWRKWKSTSRREWKQGYDGGALLLGDQLSHFQLPFGKVSCRKGWWRLLRSTCNRVEGFCYWSKTFFHDFQNWTSETLFLFSTQCIFFCRSKITSFFSWPPIYPYSCKRLLWMSLKRIALVFVNFLW